LLVGYFVLGPTELFKLTKEIGKFIQNIRTLGTEATKSFESTMENQLELQELRKAQSELSNAFSFRRSINVDQDSEAFSEIPPISMTKEGGVAATAGGVTGTVATTTTGTASSSTEDVVPIKKKKKRRVKKKVSSPVQESVEMGDIPDLDMSAAFQDEFMQGMGSSSSSSRKDEGGDASFETLSSRGEETNMEDAAAKLRKERMERLEAAQSSSRSLEASPYSKSDWNGASESDVASEILSKQLQPNTADETSLVVDTAAQSRFEAQLNGQWNQQIMANEEKLSPLAQVMERLAILEEERLAANIRLDEEFARRAEIEEKFYREKRMVLEEAAAQISAEAYSNFNFDEKSSDIISSTTTQSTTVSETTKETQQVSNSSFFNGANFNENQ
jgi:Sec-independent protein translocase protein TatA